VDTEEGEDEGASGGEGFIDAITAGDSARTDAKSALGRGRVAMRHFRVVFGRTQRVDGVRIAT
jgi:hypothetical protein